MAVGLRAAAAVAAVGMQGADTMAEEAAGAVARAVVAMAMAAGLAVAVAEGVRVVWTAEVEGILVATWVAMVKAAVVMAVVVMAEAGALAVAVRVRAELAVERMVS
eukprot:2990009-Prymnesium_polylepis.1